MKRFLEKLNTAENNIEFSDTMAVIEAHYEFTTKEFKNGF